MNADTRYSALVATARHLLTSAGNLQSIDGEETLQRADAQQALVEHLRRIQPSTQDVLEALASQMLNSLDSTLSAADGAPLSTAELDNLEVIVQVLGRPALRLFSDCGIEPFNGARANEHWVVAFNTIRNQIRVREGIVASAKSVAKVVLRMNTGREALLGSGWRLGDDLLITNRHVVCELVANRSLEPSQWMLDPARNCTADFSDASGPSATASFAFAELAYCAPESAIDVAVLRLKPGTAALPPTLKVSFDGERLGATNPEPPGFAGKEVYVVGHPFMRLPTFEMTEVFVDADGSKRCAPGYVTALSAGVPWLLHDCSTLRGNSGSAVIGMDSHEVIGIHFGGKATDPLETLGPFNAAVALAMLPEHPLRTILTLGAVATT